MSSNQTDFRLIVQSCDGNELSFTISQSAKVLALRELVAERTQNDIREILLLFDGDELCDERTLQSYQIVNDDTILKLEYRSVPWHQLIISVTDGGTITIKVDPKAKKKDIIAAMRAKNPEAKNKAIRLNIDDEELGDDIEAGTIEALRATLTLQGGQT